MTGHELQQHVQNALEWEPSVDQSDIGVSVDEGVVTLTGVRGVNNEVVVVTPRVKTTDVQSKIEAAFKRSAEFDAHRVSAAAQNGKVILTGNVRSWEEREEAERATQEDSWQAYGHPIEERRRAYTGLVEPNRRYPGVHLRASPEATRGGRRIANRS